MSAVFKPPIGRTFRAPSAARHGADHGRANRIAPVAGLANSSSGPWQLALDGLVKDPDLIARLQTGAGGVASAEPGYRLYDVAQGGDTMEEFLHDFGHRAVHEADFLNPRWAEDPSWIIEQVQSIRENPATRDPRNRRRSPKTGGAGIEAALRLAGSFLLWLARKLRAYGCPRGEIRLNLSGVCPCAVSCWKSAVAWWPKANWMHPSRLCTSPSAI